MAGCGGVAQAKWLPAIRYLQTRSEPIEITGLADPERETREKVARLYGAPAYASLEELLRRQRPDLVMVLAPDDQHVALARQAIEAGIATLVEKPLSRSLAEAAALADLAESRGVLLGGVANKRFSAPYALAKRLIGSGALNGEPTLFAGKFTLGYPYVDILEAGTVHLLDLALWIMGPIAQVGATGVTGSNGRLESAVAMLTFRSGAIGSIVTSSAALSFKPWERVEIIGRHAMLTVEDQLELTLADEEVGPAKTWRPVIPNTLMFDEAFGGYSGLLENMLDSIRGLVPLVATGRDGVAAVALIAAIHESIVRGGEPVSNSQEAAS
ncbi:MAG: Gfo/Idh/MocA family protein [Hyphomicrobiales bacterium]